MEESRKTKKTSLTSWLRGAAMVFALCLITTVIYYYSSRDVTEGATPSENPRGWIWNGYQLAGSSDAIGLGWTSMNCLNDFDNDNLLEYRCDPTVPYGLSVSLGGPGGTFDGNGDYLQGCAWSSAYGWVCFNGNSTAQCDTDLDSNGECSDLNENGVAIVPHSSGLFYRLDSPTYNSSAWSSISGIDAAEKQKRGIILSLWQSTAKDKGYIGFPAHNNVVGIDQSTPGEDIFMGCFGCEKFCATVSSVACPMGNECGAGETCTNGFCITPTIDACTIDGDCDEGKKCAAGACAACLNTSTESGQCSGSLEVCNFDDDCPVDEYCSQGIDNPNPNVVAWNCTNCSVSDIGGTCSVNREHNTCVETSCANRASLPGVVVNQYQPGRFELCGWGWHAYTEGSVKKGLGWIAFNSDQVNTAAYIDVGSGSILSRGHIYSPAAPPTTKYNAAYIIEASGDITNWYSQNYLQFSQGADLPAFLQQVDTGVYKNVLGQLDYIGITIDAKPPNQVNKYGSPVIPASDSPLDATYPFSGPFNDTVYVFYGSGATFTDAAAIPLAPGGSGAGIIVVEGNLEINEDITYEAGGITKLKELPSLVWIVKGDVSIAPTVGHISGTFIILGDGSPVKCPELSEGADGCGRFSTGSSGFQLTIHGAVLAKQFNFERTYSANNEPSEKFDPDGRLQANTPSGLKDFAKSVPRYTSG